MAPSRSTWNGVVLTSMNMLQSVDAIGARAGTRISSVSSPQSPYMKANLYKTPTFPQCLSDFRAVRQKLVAPFRGTFRGIVVNVLEVDSTLQGEPKVEFELVDSNGAWIKCCAIGRHVEQSPLKHGLEIVMYFATGRGPFGNADGTLYAMKDAVIVPLGLQVVIPAKTVHLAIPLKSE